MKIESKYGGYVKVEYNYVTAGRDGKYITVVLSDADLQVLVMKLMMTLFRVRGDA